MTNQAPDRKLLQRVRTQTEQNERLLGRTMATIIATCSTVVGWMLIAKPAPVDMLAQQEVPVTPIPEMQLIAPLAPTQALVQIDYAPIPTVAAVPDAAPAPTLMPAPVMMTSADGGAPPPAAAAPVAAPAEQAAAPAPVAVDAMPALRVVAQPTAAPVAPPPASRPKPKPGGNTGGS